MRVAVSRSPVCFMSDGADFKYSPVNRTNPPKAGFLFKVISVTSKTKQVNEHRLAQYEQVG